jgi:hypothetical protein
MNDIDIIYDIFDNQIYFNTKQLKNKVDKIKNQTIALGLLIELTIRHEDYQIDKNQIHQLILDKYDPLDSDIKKSINPYESHDKYIDYLNSDPRSQLSNFLYAEQNCDLSENVEFVEWVNSLDNEKISIVEKYCVTNEYYEIIDFIIKTKK